jgi:hypothetical protein
MRLLFFEISLGFILFTPAYRAGAPQHRQAMDHADPGLEDSAESVYDSH